MIQSVKYLPRPVIYSVLYLYIGMKLCRAVQWHSIDTVCDKHSVEDSGEDVFEFSSELPVHSHENGAFARSAQCHWSALEHWTLAVRCNNREK